MAVHRGVFGLTGSVRVGVTVHINDKQEVYPKSMKVAGTLKPIQLRCSQNEAPQAYGERRQ